MPALSFLDREHSVAPLNYNRWLIPPAALAIHLCIGQVYATSVYKDALVHHFDTNKTMIGIVFSIAIVMLGLSAAVFGTWVDRVGPRRTMFTAACCWGAGFLIAAAGVSTGQLWLVYLGYGFVGGIGLGLGYISPVSTLMKWFPDRPGLATGMAIMGFGGGAMVASPLSKELMKFYGGAEGNQVTKLFLTLGVVYFIVMMMGVFTIRVPAPGYLPAGYDPTKATSKAMVSRGNVSAANSIKTPQFWLLWVVLLCNVTAGIGILEQAADMIQDFFRDGSGVSTVSATVAAGFVGLLSVANMAGRLGWSTTSDYIGRKPTYMMYLGGGVVLYLALATVGSTSTALFVIFCAVIISFYGGGFSTVPAYLRDLFGTFQVGAIHGRLLTAWSTAGVLGPLIVNRVLDSKKDNLDANGKAIPLEAGDYHLALYIMVGVLVVGFFANLAIRPVSEKWHERGPVADAADGAKSAPAGSGGIAVETTAAPAAPATDVAIDSRTAQLVLTWSVVLIPLAYGLFNALKAAMKLFGG